LVALINNLKRKHSIKKDLQDRSGCVPWHARCNLPRAMTTLLSDIRYAVRSFVKSPVFTLAALLCLALGIGANTAIFSVLNAVVLRPLPYPEPERLVALYEVDAEGPDWGFSPADFLDIRAESKTLEDLAGHRVLNANLSGIGEPVRVRAVSVSPQFFKVFRVEPILGRSFLVDDKSESQNARNVILSHRSWQNRFGGGSDVIGTKLQINGEPHIVVGVAPASFQFPREVEMWVRSYRHGVPEPPMSISEELNTVRNVGYFRVVGRVSARTTLDQVQAELEVIASRLQKAEDHAPETTGLTVVPLQEELVGDVRPALLILLAAVGAVLLIACANVANLLLARATDRERETALRAVLGASRHRLVRQLLTENLLLGAVAGGFGLLLSLWGVDVLVRWAGDLPRSSEMKVDGWVLLFTGAVSLLTGVIFGAVPALQASRVDLRGSLQDGGRSSTGGKRRQYFRSFLIVSEVALSLVLLCGAGLFIKSLLALQSEETGFQSDHLLVMRLSLPESFYPEEAQQAAFVRAVTERVGVLPGVVSVGVVLTHPFSGTAATFGYTVGGVPDPEEQPVGEYQVVTPDYFRTMGIPLIAGRLFTDRDDAKAPQAFIVNETLANLHWPGENPIGKRIGVYSDEDFGEIVGVVGDVRHFSFEQPPRPEIYAPYAYDPWPFMALVVRTETEPLNYAGAIRGQVLAVDPQQPVYGVQTMEQVLRDSTQQRRFTVQLLGVFAAIAIVLALIGIYGVMSYSMSQRFHEMGVRLALGARRAQVLKLAMGWGLKLVLVGIVLGLGLSFALTRFASSLLYGITATDPAVFMGVSILLMATAALAAYLPAQRVSRADPIEALRYE
jgi:putative ABC transport system permease protein